MNKFPELLKKWMRFNAIGTMGVCVQVAFLFVLKTFLHLNYLLATLFAVQFALIHNFFWHLRWTWKETAGGTKWQAFRRFVKYNSSTGTLSILGNLGFTSLFVQMVHLPYLICNLMAIGACNIANFLLARNFVFKPE
jgi:putative flippase GtrA